MRAPSAKTLLSELRQLSPDDARLIRVLAGAAADGEKLRKLIDAHVPATAKHVRSTQLYQSQPWRTSIVLHAMNEILGTHGVEWLGHSRSSESPPYEYLNAGDPYVGTLIYDRDRDRLFVGSWGDLVEKHPEWESREEHASIRRGSVLPKSPAQLDHEISRALSAHRERR